MLVFLSAATGAGGISFRRDHASSIPVMRKGMNCGLGMPGGARACAANPVLRPAEMTGLFVTAPSFCEKLFMDITDEPRIEREFLFVTPTATVQRSRACSRGDLMAGQGDAQTLPRRFVIY